MNDFPVIDVSDFSNGSRRKQEEVARRVDEVCCDTGFLAINGHGVKQSVINELWDASEQFFDLPSSEKMQIDCTHKPTPYGYLPFTESLAKSLGEDTPPDLKESFNMGPLLLPERPNGMEGFQFIFAETLWPKRPDGFRQIVEAYFKELQILGDNLMQIFAVALQLPTDYFADKLIYPSSALRILNYPVVKEAPKPGQLRAGAHTDYGSLTILLPEADSRGLEILNKQGQWQEVPAIEDAFIINIGDLMSIWTNGRWVSTMHRVRVSDADSGTKSRKSIPFFHMPAWDAEIECIPSCILAGELPKFDTLTCGEHIMSKYNRTVKEG